MCSMIVLTLWSALSAGFEPDGAEFGSLYQPAFALDKQLRGPTRPYHPQAGDILLETDDRLFWKVTHNLAKTGHPHHSVIVFRKPDGCLAIAEAGSGEEDPSKVVIEDLVEHMRAKDGKTGRKHKRIWIRQRKVPLTEEQSAALTKFVLNTEGRRFARGRMLLLMTPLRTKGPLRTAWVGKPDFDKLGYFCSEYAATALVAAGLLDGELARPSATFPHDLFHGSSCNHFVNRGLKPLNECWEPPARWSRCP